MTFLSSFRTKLSLLAGLLILLFSGCDIPTEPPNFGFQSQVRTPLLVNETFTLLGTGTDESEALIDTALVDYDTLFAAGEDHTLSLVQDVSNLNVDDLNEALPSLDLPPQDLSVSLASLAAQDLSASYGQPIGTFERPALELPSSDSSTPVFIDGNQVFAPFPSEIVIAPSEINLLDFGDVTIDAVTLTEAATNQNTLRFTLENNLNQERLTDGNSDVPVLVIEDESDGREIARGAFDHAPAPGESATAAVSLAGETVPIDVRYRLHVSTPSGFQPIRENQADVQVRLASDPFEYEATTLASFPTQDELEFAESGLTLIEEASVQGFATSEATIELAVTNDFPFDLNLDVLEVTNAQAVGPHAAGHTVLEDNTGYDIPAGKTTQVTLELGQTAIARTVNIKALASSPGTNAPVTINAEDGLNFGINGNVSVEKLFLLPNGLSFSDTGVLSLDDVDQVDFGAGDFVELKSGMLAIKELTNELAIGFDELRISLPGLRTAPYRPQDSVVVRFSGTTRNPDDFQFQAIGPSSGPRDVEIGLEGLRLYPTGNQFTYNLSGTSETASEVRTIEAADEVSAKVSAQNIEPKEVRAQLSPFSVAITDDADGDGQLDVADDAEAEITDLDLSAIHDLQPEGLQLSGSRLALNLTTNVTTDVTVYAALKGLTSSGPVYLGGKGEYAVQADSISEDFAGLSPDQLIKLPLKGADSPDRPVTRTIALSRENATLDAFLSALPEELRFAGKALVLANGNRVHLRQPITLNASIGASIPLALKGEASLTPTVEADLSSLSDLTEEDQTLSVQQAQLSLDYGNELPVGFGLRLEMLSESGASLLSLPTDSQEPLLIRRAPAAKDGTAQGTKDGTATLDLSKKQLRALSNSQKIRLQLTLRAPDDQVARLRSTDKLSLGLKGLFNMRVKAGD